MKIKMNQLLTLVLIFALMITTTAKKSHKPHMHLFAKWNHTEFKFPSEEIKQQAIDSGNYVVGNSVPIGVTVYAGNTLNTDFVFPTQSATKRKVFVTIPRFVTGIPVTFGFVTEENGETGPLIQPYPNYEFQSVNNCDGIISVFRTFIDECNRLWIIDTGAVGPVQVCDPRIVVFDLKTDQLLINYQIPALSYHERLSLFVTPIVDVRDPPPNGQCRQTMVYVADRAGFILVFDPQSMTSWLVNNKLMYPDPSFGTFTIADESFDLMDGVLGMAISPKADRTRYLYFHSLSSDTENVVPLSLLDNSTIWEANSGNTPRSFMEIGSRGTQSAAEVMDRNGNMFFGLMNPIAIACWNYNRQYKIENIRIVCQNDQTLQFASGMTIFTHSNGDEELYILTNRIQRSFAGTMTTSEINFRIQTVFVRDLYNGRSC